MKNFLSLPKQKSGESSGSLAKPIDGSETQTDLKCDVKRRAANTKQHYRKTDGGPPIELLSPLHEKVASLIGGMAIQGDDMVMETVSSVFSKVQEEIINYLPVDEPASIHEPVTIIIDAADNDPVVLMDTLAAEIPITLANLPSSSTSAVSGLLQHMRKRHRSGELRDLVAAERKKLWTLIGFAIQFARAIRYMKIAMPLRDRV